MKKKRKFEEKQTKKSITKSKEPQNKIKKIQMVPKTERVNAKKTILKQVDGE